MKSTLLDRMITKARAFKVTRSYRRILSQLGATFGPDEARHGAELVTLGGLCFSIKSEEDLFILTEVFDSQCYNFKTTGPTIVVDIGMNIGVASLFFASDPNVRQVFSFEPFRTTYELACANVARNPQVAKKITTHNFGMFDRDTTQDLPYIEERKGSVGINGMPRNFTPARQDLRVQRIELRNAADVLKPIFDANTDANVVLKMDCEGSEYDIFQCLDAAGLLNRFQAIMLEWHLRGPGELQTALARHGYKMFAFGDRPNPAGMLYAVKCGG